MRSLQARMSGQLKDKSLSPDEAEDAQSPIRKLKSMFPNTPLSKAVPWKYYYFPPRSLLVKRGLLLSEIWGLSKTIGWLSE